MYKRILIPTDGSELSREAITAGVLFAKNLGASIVGLHVMPELHRNLLDAWLHHDAAYADRQRVLFQKFADDYLSFVANSALAEDVACSCKPVSAEDPAAAIIRTAETEGCDLIYMASHGWGGDTGRMLGSVTLKVLTLGELTVLVYRNNRRKHADIA